MLEEINIQNLGVIENASLQFTPGLTVITGETGAGKTMILTALGLLLGKRSDTSIIRDTADSLSVEGCWDLKQNPTLRERIEETGAELDENSLFINRSVNRNGKNRIVVGGKMTPANVIADFAENLVSIHGQSDQLRLKGAIAQREALDKYAGVTLEPVMNSYVVAYREWVRLTKLLKEIQAGLASRQKDFLLYQQAIEDFDKVRPEENEDENLKTEILTLANIEEIRVELTGATGYLQNEDYETEDIVTQLANLINHLKHVSEYDPDIAASLGLAESISVDVEELSSQLNGYISRIDGDALNRLAEAQERLSVLNQLIRKYGPTLDDALKFWEEATSKIDELNPDNNSVETVEAKLKSSLQTLSDVSSQLTELRKQAAVKLQTNVNTELSGLAMGGTKLVIQVTNTGNHTIHGSDNIEFLITTPGATTPKPLGKSASGGELSRISLALELSLADPETTPTIILDEVDAGIGGNTAVEVGKRLAMLGQVTQVIVVSHLAQVAAFADNHLKVIKETTENSTTTTVDTLVGEQKVVELTRMLSGLTDSESGREHATELMGLAAEVKQLTPVTPAGTVTEPTPPSASPVEPTEPELVTPFS